MIVLLSGATRTRERFKHTGIYGQLVCPRSRNRVDTSIPWAADNRAFSGYDRAAFLLMLERIRGLPNCLFVVAPDVVCDAAGTTRLFHEWAPRLHQMGLPVAYVGQNGAENLAPPWDDFEAFFIGGDDRWKLGPAADALAAEARARGKWVHMGRVNTETRTRHAHEIGCDSIDGTGWSKFPDDYAARGRRWFDRIKTQPGLFDRR